MDTSDIVESMILSQLDKHLSPIGWRLNVRERTWRICDGDLEKFINLQRWPRWPRSAYRGTINMGVASIPLRRFAPIWLGNKVIWDCPIRIRIGQLMPGSGDKWWDAFSAEDGPGMSNAICEAMLTYGVPFLDGFAGTEDVVAAIKNRDYVSPQFQATVLDQIVSAFHGEGEVPIAAYPKETAVRWLSERPVSVATYEAAIQVLRNGGYLDEYAELLDQYRYNLDKERVSKRKR